MSTTRASTTRASPTRTSPSSSQTPNPRNNSSKLATNSTTFIIVVVCSSIGAIVVAIFLYRTIRNARRRSQSKSLPLPPVQPLAHHRALLIERSLSRNERTQTWYDTGTATHLSVPTMYGSRTSLLHQSDPFARSPQPNDFDRESTAIPPNSSIENLVGGMRRPAMPVPSPLGSTDAVNVAGLSPSTPSSSNTSESQPTPTVPGSAGAGAVPVPLARPRPRSYHPRPLSTASTASMNTARNRHSARIRGVPHGPHSSIQIVLPTPLAPSPYNHNYDDDDVDNATTAAVDPVTGTFRRSFHASEDGHRLSVVDRWAPVPTRSISAERKAPNPGIAPEARSSTSSLVSSSQEHSSRSATSTPPNGPSAFLPSYQDGDAPPVPRIPSIYNTFPQPPLAAPGSRRGRSGNPSLELEEPDQPGAALPSRRSRSRETSETQSRPSKLRSRSRGREHSRKPSPTPS